MATAATLARAGPSEAVTQGALSRLEAQPPGALDFSPILGATSDSPAIATAGTRESGAVFKATFKNADGETTSSPAKPMVAVDPPTVTSIKPEYGSTLGGTPVTIKGTGFLTGAKVTIGHEAGSVTVVSSTEITATTAATEAGADGVTVTDSNGTSTGGPQFTYLTPPPEVEAEAASSVTQTSATLNATVNPEGAPVSACGIYYGTTTLYTKKVSCSSSPGAGTSPVAVSASVTGLTADTTYYFAVSATNAGGESVGAPETFKTLELSPPTVTSVKPEQGPAAGGTSVTIQGTGFVAPATVTIGTVVEVVSATEIKVMTTAGTSSREVAVTDADGTSTFGPFYTYLSTPCAAEPAITEQPKDQTVTAPAGATFSATASTPANCSAPTVQWWVSESGGAFKEVPGASSDTYSTPATSTADSGRRYEAVFTNSQGKATSEPATLTVEPPPCSADPAIEEQPKDQTVTEPAGASFNARASTPVNCAAPAVQWTSEAPGANSFSQIRGATSPSYTTPASTTAQSGTEYEAVFTNAFGSTTSSAVTLTVNPPPSAEDAPSTASTGAAGGGTAKSGVLGSIAEAPLPPQRGVSGNVAPVAGRVLVKPPGSSIFVALTGIRQIAFGTVVNVTNGKVTVTSVGPGGVIQTITYSQGEFRLTQERDGVVVATLVGGDFAVCPTAQERSHLARASAKHASAQHVVRKLFSEGHGKYSTKGNYAAGAVLGTRWLTEDLCDGTFIRVVTDRVAVTNLVNHHHLIVKAGHSYLAKAP